MFRFVEGLNSPVPLVMHEKILGEKNDPSVSAGVGPYLHGANGLFNIPETADGIMSAFMLPMPGALSTIPVLQRDPIQPDLPPESGGRDAEFQSIISGVTEGALDDFSNQPTQECDDYPAGGLMKVGTFVNTRGAYGGAIRPIEIERAGQTLDRLDPMALRLLNLPGPFKELFAVPGNAPSGAAILANELAARLYESLISYIRMIAPRVWIGSPGNNNGRRRDMVGLEMHINENNKIDYQSMAVVRAANSVVMNFGYSSVEGDDTDPAAVKDIVEWVEEAEYQAVEWNGRRMGLWPISGLIYMRPELWRKLSQVWPIRQYWAAFKQISEFTNGRVVVNATDAQTQRRQMYEGQMIPINGRTYIVVLDDTMPEETPNQTTSLLPGEYASDMVFVPMTVLGSMPVTYFTHFRHDNLNSQAIGALAGPYTTFVTDGGRFRWYVNFRNGCLELQWKMNPQLKCLAPMVGWRISNIKYRPLLKTRSYDPASPYHLNGGVTQSNRDPDYYSSWSPTTHGNI
jgi:hypothetical protein